MGSLRREVQRNWGQGNEANGSWLARSFAIHLPRTFLPEMWFAMDASKSLLRGGVFRLFGPLTLGPLDCILIQY